MFKDRLLITAILFSGGFARAQSAGLSGPIAGFTFDAPTRTIRAVIGSMGSASLGPAIDDMLDFASIAPRRNYGIAIRGEQVCFVTALDGLQPQIAAIPQASAPDGVAWSEDGSVAAFYSRSGNWIQIYRGFPASIQAGAKLDIRLPGSLSSIAVDSRGRQIAIGVGGDPGGVYQVVADQSFAPLLEMSAPVSLAFSSDGSTLYALDHASNQISEVNLANSAVQTWPAGADDAIAIRVAVDAAGVGVLYVAGRSSHLLLSLERASHRTIATAQLSFAPSLIEPLRAGGFLLTQRSSRSDPLWTFLNTGQPLIFFVPPPIPEGPRQEVPHQ